MSKLTPLQVNTYSIRDKAIFKTDNAFLTADDGMRLVLQRTDWQGERSRQTKELYCSVLSTVEMDINDPFG